MTTIAIGTTKGAFLHDLDAGTTSDVLFGGWKVSGLGRSGDQHLAALASNWMGMGLQRSTDLEQWVPVDEPPAHADPEREVAAIWTFHDTGDRLYAGVEDASVFVSQDHGSTWAGLDGFNDHRTRDQWGPGLGGMCAHRVLGGGQRLWVGASAIGVARSDDGGATFEFHDDGIVWPGTEDEPRAEVGYCVHNLAQDPGDADRLWRQDHTGVYRSTDGGDTWQRSDRGLPGAGFGFVMWRDHASGRLFTQPLHSDQQRLPVDGAFRAYRSDDDGASWQVAGTGWPSGPTYTQVLRNAVAGDGEGLVAMGTTGGTVWVTRDAGDTWRELDLVTPRITSLAVW